MQQGNLIKNANRKAQYPYLSIDQLKRGQQMYCEVKGQVSQFFNIKLDQRYQHRQLRNYDSKQKLGAYNKNATSSTYIESDILSNIIETPSNNKKISSLHQMKKRLNTDKMLENIQKLLIQEKPFEVKSHLVSPEKQSTKQRSQYCSSNKSYEPILSFLSIENTDQKATTDKNKIIPFQQMLKKCSKLKQITKYEKELLNQKPLPNHDMAIRFYTEPIHTIQGKEDSIYQTYKFKIRPSIKKNIEVKLSSFFQNSSIEPLRNQKTLDIRKYHNQSVLKRKFNNAVKLYFLKQVMDRGNKKARISEPVNFNRQKYESNCGQHQDMLTPWDQSGHNDFQLH